MEHNAKILLIQTKLFFKTIESIQKKNTFHYNVVNTVHLRMK